MSLRQSLLDRLNNAQFWGGIEIDDYITEALYVWQAHARYWRQRVTFNTHLDGAGASQFIYDLSVEVPQLAYAVMDWQVLSFIQFHLIEPQSGNPLSPTWQGTAMFPQDAYSDAIQRRRDRFLLDTAAVIGHYSSNAVTAGVSTVVLPSSVIDVRRVGWISADVPPVYTLLWRDDEFAANSYDAGWPIEPAVPAPTTWSVTCTQPYTIALIPPPGDAGTLDLLALAQGAPVNPTVGVSLGAPDNYYWAIKFGAMADLLSQDGPGRDLQRAAYCEMRYREGVQLCRIMPTVINCSINGNSAELDSIFNFDAYNPGWDNTVGVPQFLGLAGQNIIATSCVPDSANPVSIGLDIVPNCPIPDDPTVSLGLTADQAEVIVDEAQHLAIFKSGGEEFARAIALHKNLVDAAAQYRRVSLARAPYWPDMSGANQLELTQTAVQIG